MKTAKDRNRIIRETVKDLHTSHWDLDLLSREELEKLMGEKSTGQGQRLNSGRNPDTDSAQDSDAAD